MPLNLYTDTRATGACSATNGVPTSMGRVSGGICVAGLWALYSSLSPSVDQFHSCVKKGRRAGNAPPMRSVARTYEQLLEIIFTDFTSRRLLVSFVVDPVVVEPVVPVVVVVLLVLELIDGAWPVTWILCPTCCSR